MGLVKAHVSEARRFCRLRAGYGAPGLCLKGDAGDVGGGERIVGFGDGVGEVDGAGKVFEDKGFEAQVVAVEGGEADAEVVGEAGEEESFETALAEVAGEAGWGGVVVLEEGGVAVYFAAEAFTEDEFGVGDVEGRMEGGAAGVLEAVIGPEGLGSVGCGDLLVGRFAVSGGEGDVLGRVPVLGEQDVIEAAGERVDSGEDLVSAGDGECTAGHEVRLEIDEEEGVGLLVDSHGCLDVMTSRRMGCRLGLVGPMA